MLGIQNIEHSLLHAIIKDFVLFSSHREDTVKLEAIALWAGAELGRLELHRREVIAKGDDDLATLALLDSIWRTESTYSLSVLFFARNGEYLMRTDR